LALGVIGLVRLIPELHELQSSKTVYWIVVVLDTVLSAMTISAGQGLRRGSPWAPRLALWATGLVLTTSLGWGVLLTPEVVRGLEYYRSSYNWVLVPRLLFYMIAIVFIPYAFWVIVASAPKESRKSYRLTFGSSLFVGAVTMAVLYVSFR